MMQLSPGVHAVLWPARRTRRTAGLSALNPPLAWLLLQTNPHIVPALNLKKKVNRKLGNLLEAEWKHRWLGTPSQRSCMP